MFLWEPENLCLVFCLCFKRNKEFKIIETEESPNGENATIGDDFIYDGGYNIQEVCYRLFKLVK